MPETVWWDYIDEVIPVDDRTAYRTALEVARVESIFTGSSGGMALAAAKKVAASLDDDSLVVTLLPDSGERYLSKFNKEWMKSHGVD